MYKTDGATHVKFCRLLLIMHKKSITTLVENTLDKTRLVGFECRGG